MKWILLLAIFAIVQYEEVKGYPQYNSTEKDLRTIAEAPFIKKSIEDYKPRSLISPRFQLFPYFSHAYNDSLTYIAKKLALLEANYKELAERLKEFIEGLKTSKKDKKDKNPSLSENTVSNNKTQEHVILTTPTPNKSTDTPTPDKSTNTQKPSPAKDDDNNKNPDKKNPLHTSETVSNDETQENVTPTVPKPIESITTQKPVPTKILTTPTPNKSTDTPTPDKSTNTQKPTPAKDDDNNKNPDKKNPLHTSETVSNDETQENVTPTVPKPVESITTQKPVPTKNDEEEEPINQENKKDTLNVSTENNINETTIVPPITDNEKIVSIKPTDQIEISTTKNDETEKLTSDENEKSLESSKY